MAGTSPCQMHQCRCRSNFIFFFSHAEPHTLTPSHALNRGYLNSNALPSVATVATMPLTSRTHASTDREIINSKHRQAIIIFALDPSYFTFIIIFGVSVLAKNKKKPNGIFIVECDWHLLLFYFYFFKIYTLCVRFVQINIYGMNISL